MAVPSSASSSSDVGGRMVDSRSGEWSGPRGTGPLRGRKQAGLVSHDAEPPEPVLLSALRRAVLLIGL